MPKRSSAPHDWRELCPFPYALYDSNGVLFELFAGGQPQCHFSVVSQEARDRFEVVKGGIPARVHQVVWQYIQPVYGDKEKEG